MNRIIKFAAPVLHAAAIASARARRPVAVEASHVETAYPIAD